MAAGGATRAAAAALAERICCACCRNWTTITKTLLRKGIVQWARQGSCKLKQAIYNAGWASPRNWRCLPVSSITCGAFGADIRSSRLAWALAAACGNLDHILRRDLVGWVCGLLLNGLDNGLAEFGLLQSSVFAGNLVNAFCLGPCSFVAGRCGDDAVPRVSARCARLAMANAGLPLFGNRMWFDPYVVPRCD